ncbi:hypothetical protein ACF068_16355 [Streptomyces sp. NPDC016309]|uniref:hypothetical protein n=1 Tax=Streptomyces sp. NPDC016309 TaxID=3364965 RepID=UPI0036F50EDD
MSALAPRGLTWTVLRVHRAGLLAGTALFALSAAALVWLYGAGQEAARTDTPCGSTGLPSCSPFPPGLLDDFSGNMSRAATLLAWAPPLLAGFAGAALICGELRRGTAGLVWTQSVTPRRWLATELLVPAVGIAAGLTALSLLYRRARGTDAAALGDRWYYPDVFVALGPALPAYALLALALGALGALLTRRVLPAGGIALAVTGLVMVLGERWRDRLWPPAEVVWKNSRGEVGGGSWGLEHGLVTPTGRRIPECLEAGTPGQAWCYEARSARQWYELYHPGSHFWPLQLVETGIVLALAALATLIAFRVLRRHHA